MINKVVWFLVLLVVDTCKYLSPPPSKILIHVIPERNFLAVTLLTLYYLFLESSRSDVVIELL